MNINFAFSNLFWKLVLLIPPMFFGTTPVRAGKKKVSANNEI